jgi:O-antigen ligase
MFSLPGVLTLIAFVYLRPHEVVPFLRSVPCIPILFAVSLLGLVLDLRLRLVRPWPAPHAALVIVFYLWALVATTLGASVSVSYVAGLLIVAPALYFLVAQSAQSFRALESVCLAIVAIVLALSVMGLVQAQAPRQCIRVEPGAAAAEMAGVPEGRPCTEHNACAAGGEPGFEYVCEKAGLVGTTSIAGGRIRYRGILQDPNEFALAIGLAFPLALTLWARRRSWVSMLVLAATVGLGGVCIIFTASRTGQLVVVAVAAAYFAVRFGWKGIALGAVVAAPALVFGGRSTGEASASTLERVEAWAVGLRLWRESPLWGVGQGQFGEYHYLTAHNSFVLAAAEMGTLGLLLFVGLYYLAFKVVLTGMRRYRQVPQAAVAYLWGRGLLAALCGMVAGTFFLSLTYHPIIWVFFGLTGAYALAIRNHDPDWRLSLGWRDLCAVVGIAAVLMATLQVYTMLKGF